jgi:RNA polymerase sigma-70 factor (ECF subfamily)
MSDERLEPISPSDVDLMLRAARDDDRGAFAELVRRHQRPLMNFFARCGVYGDVEDLAQETFIRLYRYRSRYTPTAKFTTFLYLLARQTRIDALRRSQRRDALHDRVGAETPQEAEPTVVARGEGLDVSAALARLSEPMREVVVLSVMQGLTQNEVSDVLKIPVGTVKSRLFVALQRLREYLEGPAQ